MATAMIFPGQGSQTVGAGQPWRDHPRWSFVEQASEATGIDVAHLLLDAAAEELTETANAQLSTYVVSLMAAATARDLGVEVATTAGHSLGEYTALAAAGVLDPTGGAALVAARGAAMATATAARPGTMTAIIGLEVDEVVRLCEASPGEVWMANDNAPGQVVVAGDPAAIEALGEAARAAGARRPMPLKVAGAFHTPFMAPARSGLDAALAAARFADAVMPTWANVDAAPHREGAEWADLLSRQLCAPVRWREQVTAMAASGIDRFVEVGPGNVLSGMVKRIAPDAERAAAATPEEVAGLMA